jgi:hypothetical protein
MKRAALVNAVLLLAFACLWAFTGFFQNQPIHRPHLTIHPALLFIAIGIPFLANGLVFRNDPPIKTLGKAILGGIGFWSVCLLWLLALNPRSNW